MSLRLLERRETEGGNGGFFSGTAPGERWSYPAPSPGRHNSRGFSGELGLGLGGLGTSLLPRIGPLLAREPSKSRVPETIPPSLQSCPLLATPLTRAVGLTYLSFFGRSGVSLVCPPSWWQHAQATNHRSRVLSHGHLPEYRLYHVGSGPTQLFLGTLPGWGGGGSVRFYCLYTNICNMGAPLAQGKALEGIDRRSGKHVTHCTRVAYPCLGTCNIAELTPEYAPNIPRCSVHMWFLHTSDAQHSAHMWRL